MRCMFCDKPLVKQDRALGLPITLPGRGVAHTFCAERDLFDRRVFGSIHIKDMASDDLYELREMILAEINEREGKSNDVDLF